MNTEHPLKQVRTPAASLPLEKKTVKIALDTKMDDAESTKKGCC